VSQRLLCPYLSLAFPDRAFHGAREQCGSEDLTSPYYRISFGICFNNGVAAAIAGMAKGMAEIFEAFHRACGYLRLIRAVDRLVNLSVGTSHPILTVCLCAKAIRSPYSRLEIEQVHRAEHE
jgi:hypothetical protein